jgi:hypothetical protein
MVPKLPGQDTSHYNKLSWRAQANRKVYHVECNRRSAGKLKRLVQLAKGANFVCEMWGNHTHISEVVDTNLSPSKIKRLMSVSQKHTNYQCSMLLEDIVGITNLEGQVKVSQELTLSLRQILLNYVRLSDGHQLVAEVHQLYEVMGRVQEVISNTPEAEQMILMMNKNFPAYLGNVLRDQGMPDDFLLELLKRSCNPTMINKMNSCTWDPESGILTTAKEVSTNIAQIALESAPWYKNAFADLLGLEIKTLAPPPEMLYNLDKDCLIKTIHNCNEQHLPSMGRTPPRKNGLEIVDMASSDGASASLSSTKGSREASADGDELSPASGEEVHGKPSATDGG